MKTMILLAVFSLGITAHAQSYDDRAYVPAVFVQNYKTGDMTVTVSNLWGTKKQLKVCGEPSLQILSGPLTEVSDSYRTVRLLVDKRTQCVSDAAANYFTERVNCVDGVPVQPCTNVDGSSQKFNRETLDFDRL